MLFFNAKKCQFLMFKGSLGFEPELYNEKLKSTNEYTDLELVINSNMKYNNNQETRLSETHKVYQMVRRNSASITSTQSKLLVYKSMIILYLLYSSECWFPKTSDLKKWKSFTSTVTRRIVSRDDYKQKLSTLRILPIPYLIELKELMMLSNIIDGRNDVEMQTFYQLKQSKRRRIQFVLAKAPAKHCD